jgi:hypothetical protein
VDERRKMPKNNNKAIIKINNETLGAAAENPGKIYLILFK